MTVDPDYVPPEQRKTMPEKGLDSSCLKMQKDKVIVSKWELIGSKSLHLETTHTCPLVLVCLGGLVSHMLEESVH